MPLLPSTISRPWFETWVIVSLPPATGEDVIAASAIDQVVARKPENGVICGGSGQRIDAGGAANDGVIDAIEAERFDLAE